MSVTPTFAPSPASAPSSSTPSTSTGSPTSMDSPTSVSVPAGVRPVPPRLRAGGAGVLVRAVAGYPAGTAVSVIMLGVRHATVRPRTGLRRPLVVARTDLRPTYATDLELVRCVAAMRRLDEITAPGDQPVPVRAAR